MSETFIDNTAIIVVLFAAAWLIGRFSPVERFIASASGPDEAEDWSQCYPPRNPPPTIAFKKLMIGEHFVIPYSTNPELVFEKIRITDNGDNARSDIFDRWIGPEMHVLPTTALAWRTP